MKITRFDDIPRFTRECYYTIDVSLDFLLKHLEGWQSRDGGAPLDMNPDFQRGHVWTEAQQIAYVEFFLRGGRSGREVYFNCAGWMTDYKGPFVIVDGKQRLQALTRFLKDEIKVFGSYRSEYTDRMRMVANTLKFSVNNLASRAEVLQWYLEMNTGGTPHADAEIKRVKAMLKEAKK